jgi:hypothetical protein
LHFFLVQIQITFVYIFIFFIQVEHLGLIPEVPGSIIGMESDYLDAWSLCHVPVSRPEEFRDTTCW